MSSTLHHHERPAHRTAGVLSCALLAGLLTTFATPASAQFVFYNGFEVQPPPACVEKNIRIRPDRPDRRFRFAYPNADGQVAGAVVDSACLRFTGVGAGVEFATTRGALISVNDGPFMPSPVTIAENDEVVVQATAPANPDALLWVDILIEGGYVGSYFVRTRNDTRPPMLFKVGPGRTYTELAQIADLLRAGDTVELDGGVEYAPVRFTRAGLPNKPITIRGMPAAGVRPSIVGGDVTLELRGAHHYRIDNIDIAEGTGICVRNEANDLRLSNSRIHHCDRHGVLGTDEYSGSVDLRQVEVDHAGGELPGENLKHPVYVATDRDRYPGSVLRVSHSYIHDYGGNGIKSRAERTEVYYNWIDSGPDALYTLEMDGFEAYEPRPGLNADIVGNVLVHREIYGVRFGGDGTGSLRGRVRMVNNALFFGAGFTLYSTAVRFYGELESVLMTNNVFMKVGSAEPRFRLIRDEASWVDGTRNLAGARNWVPQGSDGISDGYFPDEWEETIFGAGNPGYTAVESLDDLDLRPSAPSEIHAAGTTDTTGGPEFQIPNPLVERGFRTAYLRPIEGEPLPVIVRDGDDGSPNVGAH